MGRSKLQFQSSFSHQFQPCLCIAHSTSLQEASLDVQCNLLPLRFSLLVYKISQILLRSSSKEDHAIGHIIHHVQRSSVAIIDGGVLTIIFHVLKMQDHYHVVREDY